MVFKRFSPGLPEKCSYLQLNTCEMSSYISVSILVLVGACKTIRTIVLNVTKGLHWTKTLQVVTRLDKPLNWMFWSSGSWLLIKISVLHLFLLTFQINKITICRGIAHRRNIPAFTVINHTKKGIYRKSKHLKLYQSWEYSPPDK